LASLADGVYDLYLLTPTTINILEKLNIKSGDHTHERELLRQRNHAEHLYDDLKSKLGSMELQHRSLRWKVEAPGELARYMAELKALTTRR
jgi:hypothetical protein